MDSSHHKILHNAFLISNTGSFSLCISSIAKYMDRDYYRNGSAQDWSLIEAQRSS